MRRGEKDTARARGMKKRQRVGNTERRRKIQRTERVRKRNRRSETETEDGMNREEYGGTERNTESEKQRRKVRKRDRG